MNKKMKGLLSVLLSVAMLVSMLLPATAFAAEEVSTPESKLFSTGRSDHLLTRARSTGLVSNINYIKGVSFVDLSDYDLTGVKTADYSAGGDGSVLAWFNNGAATLYIGGYGKIVAGDSLSYAFLGGMYIHSINGLDMLDTSNVTNMSNMFSNCGYASETFTLNLGNRFDTSRVTDMSGMFSYCGNDSKVFTLNLGNNFDTSNVTDMSGMFTFCGHKSKAFTLNLGDKFDTSNVTDMSDMFYNCGYQSEKFTLDLGDKFNTSNVTNMSSMFSFCGSYCAVFTLDLGNKFNTSSVTDMSRMFNYCGGKSKAFTRLDLSSFTVSPNTGLETFASDVPASEIVFGEGWANAKLPTAGSGTGAFYANPAIATNVIGATPNLLAYDWAADNRTVTFETTVSTPESKLFSTKESDNLLTRAKNAGLISTINDIKGVSFVDLSDYDLTGVKTADYSAGGDRSVLAWFDEATSVLYIGGYGKIVAGASLGYAFYYGSYIDAVNGLNMLDTSSVTNMTRMFFYCGRHSKVFTLDLGDNFDTSNVTNMSKMFYYCGHGSEAFTLNLGNSFDTSSVTTMSEMFYYCGYGSKAFTLDLGDNFNTSNVKDLGGMFYYCGLNSPVFTMDLGNNFDTSKATNMYMMFSFCGRDSKVFTLDLGNKFNTSNVTTMAEMFYYCGKNSPVFTLNLGDKFDTSKVTTMYRMFDYCGYNSEVFTLDLGDKFDTSNVINMAYMFDYCGYNSEVFTLDLGDKFDTSKVTNMTEMFASCGYNSEVFTLDLSDKFDTSKVTNMTGMFVSCGYHSKVFTRLDLSGFTVSPNTTLYGFARYIPVTEIVFGEGWANANMPTADYGNSAFYVSSNIPTKITGATPNLLAYDWAADNRTVTGAAASYYTVTATAGEGGTVVGGGEVVEGDSITLIAAANEGYTFDGWYDGEIKVCETALFTVENVTADQIYTAKFQIVAPEPVSFDFTSLRTLGTRSVAVNHETKTIEINAEADADYITIYVYQLDAIPGGTFRMASYMGNKVVYNSAGSYRIYFISNPTVTVKANITIGDQTEQYTVNTNFDMTKADFNFTNLRGENINSVTVDHDAKTIKVQAADDVDSIILYVSQHDAIYGGTLRMASYLGNKVTYASNGVYTVYSGGKENVSVKTNITINGVTEQYMINIAFPVSAPSFSFHTLAGSGIESVEIDHDAETIVINADNANAITLPIEQDEAFNGKLRMVSYLGNKVSLDPNTRVYTVSRRDEATIQVKVKVELGLDSKEYLMTINYMDVEWGFDTVNAANVSNVNVDHDTQTVTMDVAEGIDHIVLYIDQECAAGASQIWMKSYNGNDVVYHAENRTYTITKGNSDQLTVKTKITMFGETRYYDMILNFVSEK